MTDIVHNDADKAVETRASDWLWRPWYAKLWWAAIPIYWLGAAASLKFEILAAFYTSALAGFLNIFFMPLTALMVLGLGFAREWLGPIDWSRVEPQRHYRGRILTPFTDPSDPRSGGIYRRHHEHRSPYR